MFATPLGAPTMKSHITAAILIVLLLYGSPGNAQESVVQQAERLRNAGNLTAAAELLRAEVAAHPDNGDVTRLLAQTLYWLHDIEGARTVYDRAIVRHPADTSVRLQYGRMLVETRESARARALLTPLVDAPGTGAQAATLLGTLAYWEGDLTAAEKLFAEALQTDSTQADARRQLREIHQLTAAWVRVAPAIWHDDQPFDRASGSVEGGWFATPLTPVTLRVEPARYSNAGVARTLVAAEAQVGHFAPSLHLDIELAGGVLRRNWDAARSADWKGHVWAGVRLPHHVTARGRAEHAPYLSTTLGLDAAVMANSASGELQLNDPRGWLGQVTYQRQQYPDTNVVHSAYGWLLAPVVRGSRGSVQAGYAFSQDNARESRFVLAQPRQAFAPTDPRFSTAGRYTPYYTPAHFVRHEAIAAATVKPSSRATLRLGGSYSIHATEDAPFFFISNGVLQRTFFKRAVLAWNGRGTLEVNTGTDVTVVMGGEVGHTAFFRWATASAQVTYRLGAAARRRTETR